MQLEQNRAVRDLVRRDLQGRPLPVFVPWDMPDEEVAQRFPEKLKAGLVTRLGKPSQIRVSEGEAMGEVPAPPRQLIVQPPASIQLTPDQGAGDIFNRVSPSLNGPTWINHVLVFVEDRSGASRNFPAFGIHISTSKDVGAFSGDMELFTHKGDKNSLYATSLGGNVILADQEATFVGHFFPNTWHFYPRVFIPYKTFYVNASAVYTATIVGMLITVDFAAAEITEGQVFGFQAIQRREITPPPEKGWAMEKAPAKFYGSGVAVPKAAAVAPAAKAAAAAKAVSAPQTMDFANYQAIKVYEAQGNRIVWSTLQNVPKGLGGPLRVTVIPK